MGKSIQEIRDKLNEYWQGMEKGKRKKLIISSILILLTIIILSLVVTRTKYDILYENLTLKDMSEVTKELDEMGVKWKTPDKDNTNTILVPADIKNKVKIELASYGIPKEGYSFMDAFDDSSWTMTDHDKKQREQYALQNELASTISEINGIEDATVYINEKEGTGFVLEENNEETTASVLIERVANKPLKGEAVTAIRNLVAAAINMDPDMVQIIDSDGKLLVDNQDDTEFLMTDQFNITNNLEVKINDSLRNFLENIFGPKNVDIRSSVKINFDSEKTTVVEFAPPIEDDDEGLIRSMEEVEEHMVGGATGGQPGIDENTEDYGIQEDGDERYDKVSRVINYELDEINKEIMKAPGEVEAVTVAVLINQDALTEGTLTAEKEREIADLIYAATGLETRQVEVKAERFKTNDTMETAEEGKAMNWLALVLVLLAGSGVAGYFIYTKKKEKELAELAELEELENQLNSEAMIQSEVEDLEFETEESEMKAQIGKFVDKKPDSVAQLLRTWLNE